ncbi:phage major capsid protein [Geodermatophilus sp. DSM 45219]|uniref:phage major capsid family protein n=1 Tax=Geodermatophilus sp. DSM 45219 TaxID=1881103 RepID=UPI000881032F|nr:phage major capsid protein [Geodermatophilus sp. DSM 45219]SDN79211.1 Phage capsid family protein [Geodermatophilus sp. DSM 45219]
MPAILTTGAITVPVQYIEPWLGKVQNGSTIAALSGALPMLFGNGSSMTFDIGEAEYVGEGANKGPSNITPTVKTVKPFKFHKTVRWTDEVKWADEDHQLQVVEQILGLIQPSLSRALDYGVFHAINPANGAAVAAMTDRLTATTSSVEVAAAAPYTYLDAADTLVLANGYVPSDVALDPSFAARFSTARGTNSEQKLYPNFKLGTEVSELDGHRASVSKTVGAAGVAASATNLKAVVGDFSGIRWGIQRQVGLEMIEYGDPDGQGDLKRNNQVAFRAEVVYGWGIADLGAFAKVVDAVA